MLPSRGYFHDIQCPDGVCGRPYCHFGHRMRRKPTETVEEPVNDASNPSIPTYKPTPKSELEQRASHIPISYVPDLAFRPERPSRPAPRFQNKPVYNPTPINLLSSINTSLSGHDDEQKEQIIDLQQDIAKNEYDPLKADYDMPNNEYDPIKCEIDFEDLTSEFDQIDDILSEGVNTEDKLSENLNKLNDDIKKEQDRLNLLLQADTKSEDIKNSADQSNSTADKNKDKAKIINGQETTDTDKKTEKKSSDRKSKSSEKSSSDRQKDKKGKMNECSKDSEKSSKSIKEKSSTDKERKEKSLSAKERSNKKENKESKEKSDASKEKQSKREKSSSREKSSHEKTEKHKSSSSKEREKHRKEQNRDSSSTKGKEDKKEKSDKRQNMSPEKCFRKDSISSETTSESEKTKDKKTEKLKSSSSTSGSKPKEKKSSRSRSLEKCSRKDSISSGTTSESEKTKDKKTEKIKSSSSSSRSKPKEQKRSRSRSGSKTRKEERSQKRKKLDKEKHSKKRRKSQDLVSDNDAELSPKHKKSSSSSKKEKHKSDDTKKHSTSKSRSKDKSSREKHRNISENSNENDHDNNLPIETDIVLSDVDLDLEDEDETMRECYRIFNEYAPRDEEPENNDEDAVEKIEQESFTSLARKRVAHPNAETSKPYAAPRPKECKIVPPTPGQILANRYRVAKVAQANNEQESIMNEVRQITAVKTAPSLLEAARMHKMKRLERERLKKAKETPSNNVVEDILNGTNKKPTVAGVKIVSSRKINAVPNVALIEKAKERISMVRKHREEPVKTIAHTQKGGRVAHIPQVSLPDIPDVLHGDNSKLPVNVRTRFMTLLAEECFKLYSSKQDAYDRALNEEFSCYEKCKVLTTYRNSAMLAVNRLRKEIQERQSKNLGPLLTGESTQADKGSDFKGKRFYDHVKKWLLTEEELELHGYPRESEERGKAVIINEKKQDEDFSLVDENQRRCCRCSRIYQVDDDGWPLYEEDCMYHPLKKRTIRGQQVFLCCKSTDDIGCVTSDSHVSEALNNGSLEGYQTTMPSDRTNDPRSTAVYALDCEMCYTTKGLELTRVTIVDTDCKTVYESLVKPLNPIIDYNTRFSGITKDQMDRTSTNILQVQANILHLCNSDTILVGHSLESDMKALKIVHSSVIDTAVLFPHKMGLPHKRALRSLASEYLRKIIQNDVNGHDSAEDAVTCMELIKLKLKEELKLPSK